MSVCKNEFYLRRISQKCCCLLIRKFKIQYFVIDLKNFVTEIGYKNRLIKTTKKLFISDSKYESERNNFFFVLTNSK